MRVLVTPDYRTLSTTAAELVTDALRSKPDLVLGLPAGRTPVGMYEELARIYREQNLNFSGVRTFNLDEYSSLPINHPKSYHTYMQGVLFDHVNLAQENIHIPDGSPGIDGRTESLKYEKAILDAGGIDLLIAGVGANGHIGFNEPGSPFDSRTRVVDLSPETILNAQQDFGAEPPPRRAITMGIGTMLEAKRILLIASGASKADAVERTLRGPITESFPASVLRQHPRVVVIVDEAASQ
jgi:glucosamine-6-phosphate deaminase